MSRVLFLQRKPLMLRFLALTLSVLVLALVVGLASRYSFPSACRNSKVMTSLSIEEKGVAQPVECVTPRQNPEVLSLLLTAESLIPMLHSQFKGKMDARRPNIPNVTVTYDHPNLLVSSGDSLTVGFKVLKQYMGAERALAHWWTQFMSPDLADNPLLFHLAAESLISVYKASYSWPRLRLFRYELDPTETYLSFEELCLMNLLPLSYFSVCKALKEQVATASVRVSSSWSAYPVLTGFVWRAYQSFGVTERFQVFRDWWLKILEAESFVLQASRIGSIGTVSHRELRNILVSSVFLLNHDRFGEKLVKELYLWLQPQPIRQSSLDFYSSSATK